MEDHEPKQQEVESTTAPELAPGPQAEQPKKKRPYVRPSFKYERVFETNALSCGKVGVTQAACRNNRKVS
jgi:hypothetical protein